MPAALVSLLPLTLTGVLLCSGIAKLRHPDDVEGWRELGVPQFVRRPWLVAVHPWAEIALAVAVAILGGWLGAVASLVAVALMATYTVLVARAARHDASCACFGQKAPVTRVTVVRNAWLTALAAGATAVVWAAPSWGGAVAVAVQVPGAFVAAAAAAVTTATILWPHAPVAAPPATPSVGAQDADSAEYLRVRTPAVPVTLADGTVENLRTLAARKPMLLLAVSPTCGACVPVISAVAGYRSLLPEVDVRLLLMDAPDNSPLTEQTEPQSLHDPHGYVRGSIMDWPTPTAVLVGIDGMLAGGPEIGHPAISTFVDDIYENLHGERPTH